MDQVWEFDGGTIEVTERGYATGEVRCLDRAALRWRVKLPELSSGYMMPLDASAEVLEGMLFVCCNHEHGNAGGGPYFTQLHRVLPGGGLAWSRMIDARGRWPRLRLRDGLLGVECGWAEDPFGQSGDVQERWLDPETGAESS